MTSQKIEVPRPIAENFARQAARFHVLKGGRGSGKTQAAAAWACARAIYHATAGRTGVILCGREHLVTLEESSLQEIKGAIARHPWMAPFFEVGEKFVRTAAFLPGRVDMAFAGLRHNLDGIKSKARILDAWVEEAENVSEVAWRKLIPTIREEGSKLVVTYNPESSESATHRRFAASQDDDICVTHINWDQNPWFPKVLETERLRDLRDRPDIYDHVWEGQFLTRTDAQIFAGKFQAKEFTPGHTWDGPYLGMDFGFAQDPTTAVKCWIWDKCLWVEHEAGKVGLEIDETAAFVSQRVPELDKHVTRADSARPETISFLKRHGIPRILGVKKWPGSVEDGIEFMKSFDRINVHPRCSGALREFRLYSYKVDKQSGDILPKVMDADNHYIDALRYALAPMIQRKSAPSVRAL